MLHPLWDGFNSSDLTSSREIKCRTLSMYVLLLFSAMYLLYWRVRDLAIVIQMHMVYGLDISLVEIILVTRFRSLQERSRHSQSGSWSLPVEQRNCDPTGRVGPSKLLTCLPAALRGWSEWDPRHNATHSWFRGAMAVCGGLMVKNGKLTLYVGCVWGIQTCTSLGLPATTYCLHSLGYMSWFLLILVAFPMK